MCEVTRRARRGVIVCGFCAHFWCTWITIGLSCESSVVVESIQNGDMDLSFWLHVQCTEWVLIDS